MGSRGEGRPARLVSSTWNEVTAPLVLFLRSFSESETWCGLTLLLLLLLLAECDYCPNPANKAGRNFVLPIKSLRTVFLLLGFVCHYAHSCLRPQIKDLLNCAGRTLKVDLESLRQGVT